MNQFKSGAQAGLAGNLSNRARGKKALRKALAAVKKSSPHVVTTTARRETPGPQPPRKRKEYHSEEKDVYETPPVSAAAGMAMVDFSSLLCRKKRRMSSVDDGTKGPLLNSEGNAKEGTMCLLSLDKNVSIAPEKRPRGVSDTGGTRLTPLFAHCAVPHHHEDAKKKKSIVATPPVGFSNLGNTCYLNSTVQCMLNVPEFVSEIEKNVGKSKEASVTRALYEIIQKRKDNVTVTSLAPVKSALEHQFPSVFAGTNQQDAHECFVRILEAIEREHSKSFECPFSFKVSVEMRCKNCRHQTLKEEEGNVDIGLDLPLGHDSSPVEHSIEKLLAVRYFRAERIFKNCDGCGEKDVVHGLRRRLLTYPKALVIHLKRFVFNAPTQTSYRRAPTFSKNSSIVQVPQNLVGTSLMLSSSTTMSLSGIVHHQGSRVESGHYVADVYREPSWYGCNDSIVSKVPPTLASSTCYMAMYHTQHCNDQ